MAFAVRRLAGALSICMFLPCAVSAQSGPVFTPAQIAQAGALRDVNGTFAAQIVTLTIDAVQSGALLCVGSTRSAHTAAHDTAVCPPLGDGEDNGEERGDRGGEDELRPADPEVPIAVTSRATPSTDPTWRAVLINDEPEPH